MGYDELANLMFPMVCRGLNYYEETYPKRSLPSGAKVTRYAPSPTGFQHIGGVFSCLIDQRIAKQSGGIFYIRVEDTDQKREVAGALEDTIETMHHFGLDFDEGMVSGNQSKGEYGPYRQSERGEIYQTYAFELVKNGLAYPCFCSTEDLGKIREIQTEQKETTGYYGKYAHCRDITIDEATERIRNGEKYIVRLKSPGNPQNRVEMDDLIKGHVSFPENNQDIVLIKADGLPTYHFAHAIDDHLMGTTHVIRGEEWLSSVPIHLQLFEVLGFELPQYAHTPNVMKLDGESKRKLSKRKDPEAAVSYYHEMGYPVQSVIEYLLNLINSGFEDWRAAHPMEDCNNFEVSLAQMSKSGALFDLIKLNDVSKDVIARMNVDEVYECYAAWAKVYDHEMYDLVTSDKALSKEIFNIGKDSAKPRKDFSKWSEVKGRCFYFFDELFIRDPLESMELPKTMDLAEARRVVEAYSKVFQFELDPEAWFEQLKAVGSELGYTANKKDFKAQPQDFNGMVADLAGAIRAAITHRANTPDLYTVIQILGEEKVKERFEKFIMG